MEKAQPRTETAMLIDYLKRCATEGGVVDNMPNKRLIEIADRLTEQEETIRHLRVELCNASAVAMERKEAIETFEAYIGVLNHRLTTFVKIGVPDSA
jgi:archaellum component FlaC